MMLDSGLIEAAQSAIERGVDTFIHKGRLYEIRNTETLELARLHRVDATRRRGSKPYEKRGKRATISRKTRRFRNY